MSEQEYQDAPPVEADAVGSDQVETDQPDAGEDHDAAPAKSWTPEDEEKARKFRWKPRDEWKGDIPSGYIEDPREWVERVERSPVYQVVQAEKEEMAKQQAEILRKIEAMNDKALERQRAEYEGRLQQIQQRQRRAVEEADTATWDTLEKQRQDMMREAPEQMAPQGPAPEVQEYQQQHQWAQNPALWQEAVQAVNYGLSSGAVRPGDAAEQLKFAEQTMKAKYPHLFPEDQPKPAPARQRVDGGGLASGPASGRSAFDKLDNEAKAAFKRFVGKGLFEDNKQDREEFAREYNAT